MAFIWQLHHIIKLNEIISLLNNWYSIVQDYIIKWQSIQWKICKHKNGMCLFNMLEKELSILIQYCVFIFLPLHIYWPEKQWIYPFPYFFSGTISIFFFSLHIFIGPRCPWGPIYGSWCHWLTDRLFVDLTDATLADDDSNSIPTDDVNKAILGNVAI